MKEKLRRTSHAFIPHPSSLVKFPLALARPIRENVCGAGLPRFPRRARPATHTQGRLSRPIFPSKGGETFGMSFFDLPPIIERMLLVSDKISDLNFSTGQQPQVEINGKLTSVQPLGLQKLSPYQTEIIAMTLLEGNADAASRLVHTGAVDLSWSLPTKIRFRVNIFQQRGTYSIVMRVIPTEIPSLESLGLPMHLAEIV